VAVPVFRKRVAPVFDWAGKLLVAEVGDEASGNDEEKELADVEPLRRPALLRRAGVGVLICGGISQLLGTLVAAEGIQVIPGIAGGAQEVLAAYVNGQLRGPQWAMPGWCGGPNSALTRGRRGGFCGGRGGRRRGRGRGASPGGGMA
jgi:predicted Fe-Mo cluster-binding NifX family protein